MHRTLLAAFALLLLPAVARAQGSEHDLAVKHFEVGRAYVHAGKCDAAIPELTKSIEIERSVGAHLNRADCYVLLGKLEDAWLEYRRAEETAVAKKDNRLDDARRALAVTAGKLLHVVLRVPADDMTIQLDGRIVPASSYASLYIMPGPHTLEAARGGQVGWRASIDGPAGATKQLDVTWSEPPPPGAATREAPPVAPAPVQDRGSRVPTLGVIVGGVGVLALGAGITFGLLASGARSDLAAEVRANPRCVGAYPGSVCDPSTRAALGPTEDRLSTFATVSTISFIASGVFLAAGIVLYLTAPKQKATLLGGRF